MTSRRSSRPRTLASLVVLGLVLAACGGNDDPGDDRAAAPNAADVADATTVTMRLVAFKPGSVEIDAGTAVTWVNEDPGAHTATSGEVEDGASSVTAEPDGVFDSGQLATGESFEFVFDEPGTYSYFCELHPATMRGVVTVR